MPVARFDGPLGKYGPVARRMRRRGYSESDILGVVDRLKRQEEQTGVDPIEPLQTQFRTQAQQGVRSTSANTPQTPFDSRDPMQRLGTPAGAGQGQQGGAGQAQQAAGADSGSSRNVGRRPEPETMPGTLGMMNRGETLAGPFLFGMGSGEGAVPRGSGNDGQFRTSQEAQEYRDRPEAARGAPPSQGPSRAAGSATDRARQAVENNREQANRPGGYTAPGDPVGTMPRGANYIRRLAEQSFTGDMGDKESEVRGGSGQQPPTSSAGARDGFNFQQFLQRVQVPGGGNQQAPQVPQGAGQDDQSPQSRTNTDTSPEIKQRRDQQAQQQGAEPTMANVGPGGGPGTSQSATGVPQATPGAMQAQQAQADGGGGEQPGALSQFANAVSGALGNIDQQDYRNLMRFGLSTMAADANPNTHGLAALGQGGLSVMQANRQRQQDELNRRYKQAQIERMQQQDQPQLAGTITGRDGTVYGYDNQGNLQPLKTPEGQPIQAQQQRPYTRLEAAEAAVNMATEKVPQTGPDGEPIPFGDPVERVNYDKARRIMASLGHDPAGMFDSGQSGQGGDQFKDMPLTEDGRIDTSQLSPGEKVKHTRDGQTRRAIYLGTDQDGRPRFQPVSGAQ